MQSKKLLCKPNLRGICTHSALLCPCDRKEDPCIKEVKKKKPNPSPANPWILLIAQQTQIQNISCPVDKPFWKVIRNAKVGSIEQKVPKNSLKYLPQKYLNGSSVPRDEISLIIVSMKTGEIAEYLLVNFPHFGDHRWLQIYEMAVSGVSLLKLYT